MRRIKENRGITLIALVVSIIVLLILAGVSIAMLTGDNGLIAQAQNAKEETRRGKVEDEIELMMHEWVIKKNTNQDASFKEFLNGKKNNSFFNNVTEVEEEKEYEVEKDGYVATVKDDGSVENLRKKGEEAPVIDPDIIPIKTAEQLQKIGTGEEITIDGNKYKFEKEKTYVLQNDISYTGDYTGIGNLIKNKEIIFNEQNKKIVVAKASGVEEYYTEDSKYYMATNKYGYIIAGLELYYDGIDNTGTGTHSNSATEWKDLSGNNRNGTLVNFGTSVISGWNNTYLSFDGVNDWVNCGEINSQNLTLEAVYRTKVDNIKDERMILENCEAGGVGIVIDNNNKNCGTVYTQQFNTIYGDTNVKNKIISHSLTYNKQKEAIYIDGTEKSSIDLNEDIKFPESNTVMAIGTNPSGTEGKIGFAEIDVYAVRIYNRGLSAEEVEVNNKADNKRFKNQEVIPIYSEEQLLKAGTGEKVTVSQESKEYEYKTGAVYELKNDITVTGDYTNIRNKINDREIEIKPNNYKITSSSQYYTANSRYTIAVNKYGYVPNDLQLHYDGIDNAGTGTHSSNATKWKDLSGNGNDGTLKNMTTSSCWDANGLNFDGTDDFVLIAQMNYSNITAEAVASRKQASEPGQYIVNNAKKGGWGLVFNKNGNSAFMAYVTEDNAFKATLGIGVKNDELSSMSGIYNGSIVKNKTDCAYKELAASGTMKNPEDSTCVILGARADGNQVASTGYYLNGKISSVRIYNRALTDEEVAVNSLADIERFGI